MFSKIQAAALVGIDAAPVEVEADIAPGLPNFVIVGLPGAAVKEARDRVKAAIKNSGLPFPKTRLTVNLAPADIRKEGPAYDLAIAVAVMHAGGVISVEDAATKLFIGELALDGALRPIFGTLSFAIMAVERGFREIYLPSGNADEAAMALWGRAREASINIRPVANLPLLAAHLRGEIALPTRPVPEEPPKFSPGKTDLDFSLIKGQERAKRALEIAAAGGHNVLLSGPPGSGKTLLAKSLPTILPSMTIDEMLEVTKIHSVAGLAGGNSGIITDRPFRAPHHTASGVALIGGGSWPKPGEVSLAHRGVLFLDEFPEFPRQVLENLRQPLEDGLVRISRAHANLQFPAKFMLVAAENPCPCGFASDADNACTCNPGQLIAYRKKISGPLLDRLDLRVEVPRVRIDDLHETADTEGSSVIRDRVQGARDAQLKRLHGTGIYTNAEMTHKHIKSFCRVLPEASALLLAAAKRLKLSARAYHRTIKIAQTIADIEGGGITVRAMGEALHFRE